MNHSWQARVSPREWKVFRGGSVMMPVGRFLSWDDFESAHLLQFLPFEEAQLGDTGKVGNKK